MIFGKYFEIHIVKYEHRFHKTVVITFVNSAPDEV